MPTLRLTDPAVKRLKTADGADRTEFWDTATQGLGLRVSASGARSWVMILRVLQAGVWKQQRVTIGKYPAVSLADARQLALEARTRAEQGGDPASVRREQRAELEKDSRNTFAAVVADFLSKYRGRQKRRPGPAHPGRDQARPGVRPVLSLAGSPARRGRTPRRAGRAGRAGRPRGGGHGESDPGLSGDALRLGR